MIKPPRNSKVAVFAAIVAIALTACSGGQSVTTAPSASVLASTVTGFDTSLLGAGVVGVQFTVTGPSGAFFDISPLYDLNGLGSLPATPVTITRAGQVGIPLGLPNIFGVTGLSLPSNDGTASPPSNTASSIDFVFWWEAGADLGFITGNVNFNVGFSNGPSGVPSASTGAMLDVQGGVPLPVLSSAGAAAGAVAGNPTGGAVTGRAGHEAGVVSGGVNQDLLITGGFAGTTAPNAFDSADRFSFNQGNGMHVVVNSGMGTAMGPRAMHQATTFLTNNSGLRVLVTGGVDNVDATQVTTANRVSGATITGTGAVFNPGGNVIGMQVPMQTARFAHTATWTPFDQIAIIGGGTSTGPLAATASIEHYDTVTGTFFTVSGSLNDARLGHQSVLLPDGRIFVCGGENPAAPGALACEIYDPATQSATAITSNGSMMSRVNHTATRLFNGWVLILGGQDPATGDLAPYAMVYRPAEDSFGMIPMVEARTLHEATLLGSGQVLASGGLSGARNASLPGEFAPSNSLSAFRVDATAPAGFTATAGNGLATARAEHSASATFSGRVFVVGGRNLDAMNSLAFLDDVEVLPFSNTVPVVSAFTSTTFTPTGPPMTSNLALNVTIDDADADGGYVVIRWRQGFNGPFAPATIISQVPSTVPDPSTGALTFPNLEVGVGQYSFLWDFAADGAPSGQTVQVEVIPVGATLGTPARFSVTLP